MIQVRGKQFFDGSEEILFKGIGIGSWLNMEHFMLGLPGCDFQIRKTIRDVYGEGTEGRFYDRFVHRFVSEADFKFLKSLGINLVRVPFNYHLFLDDMHPGRLKEEGFACFDYLLEMCEKYGIYALPDLHAAPGGQNPDWHSDNGTGHTLFWQYDVFQEQAVQIWQAIARRYADREYLLGYDILNEPFLIPDHLDASGKADPTAALSGAGKGGLLPQFYQRVTKAIREVDGGHIIFLEGDHFASDFTCLEGTITDQQTALTFHFYPTVWDAELFEADYVPALRRQRFEEEFTGLIRIRDAFGLPILCGEAGYDIANNGLELCMELVRLTMELFARYRVSFTLWCYKDADFMGLVYPAESSPWMRLASQVHQKWTHYEEMKQADGALNTFLPRYYPEATDQEKYLLSFRQRAVLYPVAQKYVLKPLLEAMDEEDFMQLPDSFAFEVCGFYEEYARIYRNFSFRPGK